MGTQVTLLADAHEGRSAAVCLARSRSACNLSQNLQAENPDFLLRCTQQTSARISELCVWVYVGLGWKEKEVDGNKVRLMGS
jgi:hypothetical protein